ncbi:MAG: carbonic anhydrase [Planctomycetota bacterium]
MRSLLRCNRSVVVLVTGLATLLLAVSCPAKPAGCSPDEALARLLDGNKRFVRGQSLHPHESADYRASLAKEQHPFVTILACSDSRVTPAIIFDQGVGDLFVVRVAGNVVDEDVTGSIEYAVDHLGTQLVLVVGHENCGAVSAAYHEFVARDLGPEPDEIESLLGRIASSVAGLDADAPIDEQIAIGVVRNVENGVDRLSRVADLRDAIEGGRLEIRGAVYDVATGKVRLLP